MSLVSRNKILDFAVSLSIIASLLGCYGNTVPPVNASETALVENSRPAPASLNRGEIGNVRFSIQDPYVWRDWQPLVRQPGPDGGSPLMASFRLTGNNPTPTKKAFSIRAWVSAKDGVVTPVEIVDRTRLSIERLSLDSYSKREISLLIPDGPYLDPGMEIALLLEIKAEIGKPLLLSSLNARVHEVH